MLTQTKVLLHGGPHHNRSIWLKECPEEIKILNCSSPSCDGIALTDELIVYGVSVYRKNLDDVYVYSQV